MASTSSSRKRKREGEQDDYSGGIEREMSKFMSSSTRKHTIDSDEEEDDDDEDYNKKKYSVMKEDDIEGQEAATEDFDGEIKITPFNMKDELEEGYFDGSGMYIWNKKEAGQVKDSWLDSIDWVKVKQNPDEEKPSTRTVVSSDGESDSESSVETPVALFEKVIQLLKPGESILKAIKRLGGGKQLSASERLKQKKLAKLRGEAMDVAAPGSSSGDSDNQRMSELTDLANEIMKATGNMDVYEETYEGLMHKVSLTKRPPPEKPAIPTPIPDDGLDMFSDEYDKK